MTHLFEVILMILYDETVFHNFQLLDRVIKSDLSLIKILYEMLSFLKIYRNNGENVLWVSDSFLNF